MKKLFTFSLLALALYSCKKEQTLEPTTQTAIHHSMAREANDFTVIDGRLAFASDSAFHDAMAELNAMDESQHQTWYGSISGFTSLAGFYAEQDAKAEAETGISADSLISTNQVLDIQDHALASVLNRDGMIQIGNDVHIISLNQDTVYTVAADQTDIIASRNWSSSMVKKTAVKEASCNWFSQHQFYYQDDNGHDFPQHNGRATRLTLSKWNTWYLFYSTAGVRARIEKHTRLAGWLNNTNMQYVNYTSGWVGEARWMMLPSAGWNIPPTSFYGSGILSKQITHVWYTGWKSAPSLCYYPGDYPFNGYVNYAGAIKHWAWNH